MRPAANWHNLNRGSPQASEFKPALVQRGPTGSPGSEVHRDGGHLSHCHHNIITFARRNLVSVHSAHSLAQAPKTPSESGSPYDYAKSFKELHLTRSKIIYLIARACILTTTCAIFIRPIKCIQIRQLFLVLPEHTHARMWKEARRCQFRLAQKFASPCGAS